MYLRMGFYGGAFEGSSWDPVNAEEEMNKWIATDVSHVEDGLHGTIGDLKGWEAWTASPRACLNIQDMEVDAAPGAVEADALVVSDGEDEDEGEMAGTAVATTTTANSARRGVGGRSASGDCGGVDARLPERPIRSQNDNPKPPANPPAPFFYLQRPSGPL